MILFILILSVVAFLLIGAATNGHTDRAAYKAISRFDKPTGPATAARVPVSGRDSQPPSNPCRSLVRSGTL